METSRTVLEEHHFLISARVLTRATRPSTHKKNKALIFQDFHFHQSHFGTDMSFLIYEFQSPLTIMTYVSESWFCMKG